MCRPGLLTPRRNQICESGLVHEAVGIVFKMIGIWCKVAMMRPVSQLSILILFAAICTAAQTPGPNRCPAISILGPTGVTNPGDNMTFRATIEGGLPPGVERKWTTVGGGAIVEGQGTELLSVRTPKLLSFNITATVEFVGLPSECENHVSETAGVACTCTPVLIDEYQKMTWTREKQHLNTVAIKAREEPLSKIFILAYFPDFRRVDNGRIDRIKKYLSKIKSLPTDRFEVLIIDDKGEYTTKHFLVPPGASYPIP